MSLKNSVLVALGTFDGLHIGHRAVMTADKSEYDRKIALMFKEHPQRRLKGDAPSELITFSAREKLLNEWGFSAEYVDFSVLRELSPEEFFNEIILSKLHATALCCGFNYRFGKGGAGDAALLKSLCDENGLKLTVCEAVNFNGAPVSSSRIRDAVKNGDMRLVKEMLGRYYSYSSEVFHGDERGRLLGSPTINQFFEENLTVPKYAVYASFTVIDGVKYPSVTNVGVRPTVKGGSEKRSETNIVGFSGDLYGKCPEVQLVEIIRDEMQFNSFDELSKQIYSDREKALEILSKEEKS